MMTDFMGISFFLDIGFAALLVVVLIYAVRLNRHIARLQKSKAELEKLLQGFITATSQAENAVRRLKKNSTMQSDDLERSLAAGKQLQSDLAFLNSRAEKLADKLEHGIRAGRGLTNPDLGPPESDLVRDPMPREDLAREERQEKIKSSSPSHKGKSKSDLLKALQGMR